MSAPVFYLGTHHPHWLWSGAMDCHLFVSHGTLRRYKTLRPAAVPGWALDSRGFSELRQHGEWRISPRAYAEATARYDREIGRLEWAAPQDRMCERAIIDGGVWGGLKFAGTRQFLDPGGKRTYEELCAEHQRLTVANFLELTALWPDYSGTECPYMPVLQGEPGNVASYLRCARMYEDAGVRLADYPVVGVGSVCRIQDSPVIGRLARGLAPLDLALHWFGLKLNGLPQVWPHITSHDSMAWSYSARRSPRMEGCTHVRVRGKYAGQPSTCANCAAFARKWGAQVTALGGSLRDHCCQEELFGAEWPGDAA